MHTLMLMKNPSDKWSMEKVKVNTCPWAEDPEKNEDVKALLDKGFKIIGHIDGVED